MKQPLNFPKLMKNISKKHNEFIRSLGNQSEKVIADSRLNSERIVAKVRFILNYFTEIGIIGNAVRENEGGYNKISVFRDNTDNSVNIWINDHTIVITRSNFWIQSGCALQEHPKKCFYDIDDDFDWISFADFLLDYIHEVIYSRHEACEQKIKNILG